MDFCGQILWCLTPQRHCDLPPRFLAASDSWDDLLNDCQTSETFFFWPTWWRVFHSVNSPPGVWNVRVIPIFHPCPVCPSESLWPCCTCQPLHSGAAGNASLLSPPHLTFCWIGKFHGRQMQFIFLHLYQDLERYTNLLHFIQSHHTNQSP